VKDSAYPQLLRVQTEYSLGGNQIDFHDEEKKRNGCPYGPTDLRKASRPIRWLFQLTDGSHGFLFLRNDMAEWFLQLSGTPSIPVCRWIR